MICLLRNHCDFLKTNVTIFCFQCSSDSDCNDDTDANRCVSGRCVCGSTGGKCTTTSGKPVCTKSTEFSTAATSVDGATAVCSVRYFVKHIGISFCIHFCCNIPRQLLLLLLLNQCKKVDGSTGDGTTKGTCSGADDKCHADGTCSVCAVLNTFPHSGCSEPNPLCSGDR